MAASVRDVCAVYRSARNSGNCSKHHQTFFDTMGTHQGNGSHTLSYLLVAGEPMQGVWISVSPAPIGRPDILTVFMRSFLRGLRSDIITTWRIVRHYRSWIRVLVDFRTLRGWKQNLRGPLTSITLRHGPSVLMRRATADLGALHEVTFLRVYFPGSWRVEPTDTVIDLGAHIGSFALFAALQAPRGRVIAYEPQPENAAILRQNIKRNRFQNVEMVEAAVGKTRSRRPLTFSPTSTTIHSFDGPPDAASSLVPVVTLADVFEDHRIDACDFLKIDVEGAEFDILESEPSLLPRIGKIALEYHNTLRMKRLLPLLERHGFQVRVAPNPDQEEHGFLYARLISQ